MFFFLQLMYNKLKKILYFVILVLASLTSNPSFASMCVCVYNYLKSSFDRIIVLLFQKYEDSL
jgi:hypothetical protein